QVEAHLIIPLAGAAVCDEPRVLRPRRVDQELREQRAAERRRERVAVLVEGPGLQGGPDEVADEDLAGVLHDRFSRAARDRLLLHRLEITGRAKVAGARHDLEAERLAQPGHRDARVEPTGIGEHAGLAGVRLTHFASRRAMPKVVNRPSSARACRSVEAATKTVSSPASVPIASSIRDASSAAASAFAVPGSERNTTRLAASAPSTG